MDWNLIVIGGGIAGLSAAKSFLEHKPDSKILLISSEDSLPYKRTRLSKILASEESMDLNLLEPESYYENIEVLLGYKVIALNAQARTVHCDHGEIHKYEQLVIASGAQAFVPENLKPYRSFFETFRTRSDLEVVRKKLAKAKRILVVGSGVLALELADQALQNGKKVTLTSRSYGLMRKELTPRASEILEEAGKKKGLLLRYEDQIETISEKQDGRKIVQFGDKSSERYDLIIAALGSKPDTVLAHYAGCTVEEGILTNENMLTSTNNVYAAGDCVQLSTSKVSHLWHAAETMGKIAGSNAAGVQLSIIPREYRLKVEVFGTYAWSMIGAVVQTDELIEYEFGSLYRALWLREGKITGLVMVGNKELAKVCEDAVLEAWTADELGLAIEKFQSA